MIRRLIKCPGLTDIFGVCLLFTYVLRTEGFAGDPGVGWHLLAGRWIWEHKAIPWTDPFLFSTEGQRWIHNQWLADIFFWFAYSLGGLPFLHALVTCICLCSFVIVLCPFVNRAVPFPVRVFLAFGLAIFAGSFQWLLRPVIFSFLLAAIVYRLVYPFSSVNVDLQVRPLRAFILLPVLFLLWANLHPGFVIGLGIIGIALFSSMLEAYLLPEKRHQALVNVKVTLALLLCCLAATFVNPYGINLHLNIFRLISSDFFMNLNSEWLPPKLTDHVFTPFFIGAIVFVVLLLNGGFRRSNIFDILLCLLFLFLSLRQRRYIPFWGIALFLPLAKLLAVFVSESFAGKLGFLSRLWSMLLRASNGVAQQRHNFSNWSWSLLASVALCGFTLVTGHLPLRDAKFSEFSDRAPKEIAQYLKREQSRYSGYIFNHPNHGGYLSWILFPQKRVFIDDRNELNGEEKYREFFQAADAKPGWEDVFKKYNFEWAIVEDETPLATELKQKTDWQLVFQGGKSNDKTLLLFRRNGNREVSL